MKLDPRWITTRYAGPCSKCGATIPKGSQAFYYPNGRKIYGSSCCGWAQFNDADFAAARFDEFTSTGQM